MAGAATCILAGVKVCAVVTSRTVTADFASSALNSVGLFLQAEYAAVPIFSHEE
jgi:hypothetical protein